MGWKNLFSAFRQKPLVVLDFNDVLNNGETKQTADVPIVGWVLLYGMIYTSQEISVVIEQGTQENPINYRSCKSYTINSQDCVELEIPIVGKFMRISIVNNSGLSATIESFFCLRGLE